MFCTLLCVLYPYHDLCIAYKIAYNLLSATVKPTKEYNFYIKVYIFKSLHPGHFITVLFTNVEKWTIITFKLCFPLLTWIYNLKTVNWYFYIPRHASDWNATQLWLERWAKQSRKDIEQREILTNIQK